MFHNSFSLNIAYYNIYFHIKINKMSENSHEISESHIKLADSLISELKLSENSLHSPIEIRTELIQILPDILKLDISLLQNEIVFFGVMRKYKKDIGSDINDLQNLREKDLIKSMKTVKKSYEFSRKIRDNVCFLLYKK